MPFQLYSFSLLLNIFINICRWELLPSSSCCKLEKWVLKGEILISKMLLRLKWVSEKHSPACALTQVHFPEAMPLSWPRAHQTQLSVFAGANKWGSWGSIMSMSLHCDSTGYSGPWVEKGASGRLSINLYVPGGTIMLAFHSMKLPCTQPWKMMWCLTFWYE